MASRDRASSAASLTWGGFFLRLLAAAVLVFASYNPEGYSYYHWLRDTLPGIDALLALAGVALVIGWAVFIRATLRSLGVIGLTLAIAFFGALFWLLVERDLISPDNLRSFTYVIQCMISAVLGVGMSWSFIRRRLSGQYDVDDVD